MTPEERKAQMQQRDADIAAYYQAGHSIVECGRRYGLKRQRVLQILKAAEVWKPYVKGDRTQFLGVSVSEPAKAALKQKAEEQGISVSQLTANTIDEMLARDAHE